MQKKDDKKSSSKIVISLIIVIAFMILSAGIYIIFIKDNANFVEEEINPVIGLTDYRSKDVLNASISDGSETMLFESETITNADGTSVISWYLIEDDERILVDESRLRGVLIYATNIRVTTVFEEEQTQEKLEELGLVDPYVIDYLVNTIEIVDGVENITGTENVTLYVGNETGTKDGYYVMKKGDVKVYKTDTYSGQRMQIDFNEVIDKSLVTMITEEVTKLGLIKNGEIVFSADLLSEYNWLISEPVEFEASASQLVPIVENIVEFQAAEYIDATDENIAKYRIDDPEYILSFGNKDEEYRMLIGMEERATSYFYAMYENTDKIFRIGTGYLNFVDKELLEIISPYICLANIWDVTSINVTINDVSINSEILTEEGQSRELDRFYIDGKEAWMEDENGEQPYRDYYISLIAISVKDMELDAEVTGVAEITIEFVYKDGRIDKYDYVKRDGETFYVLKNGEYSGVYVSSAYFYGTGGVLYSYNNLLGYLE